MANKVKYGLKNVHYAVATIATNGTATYGSPVAWPGAVNLSLDPEGDTNKFYADNIAYAQFATNAGYSGDFESALVPDSFKIACLGYATDSKGVLYEDAGAAVTPFALMFQFEGDQEGTRHVMYNCVATRPSVSGATKEDTTEPQTETCSIECASIYNAALAKDIVKASAAYSTTTTDPYYTWFDSVYQPTT